MGRFDGRVALVTGGARGQGRSHAVGFAREGADVVVCDVGDPSGVGSAAYPLASKDDLDETVRQVQALGRRCIGVVADVRDLASVQVVVDRAIAELGGIDFAVANAGIITYGHIAQIDAAQWQDIVDVNLTGVFNTFRAVLPHMLERRSGRIVAISSMAGRSAFPNLGHYTATKWGVVGLAKAAAQEVAADGITINVICPTTVDTPMIHNPEAYSQMLPGVENPTIDDMIPVFSAYNPIPIPWVSSEDVTASVLFLCSDDARYITGETISVAAGMSARNLG